MLVKQIIEQLEKIYQLQKSLLIISKEKTELIKNNDIDQFNQLLMTERKHVQAIEQLESKRMNLTDEFFEKEAPESERTISQLIELVKDEEERKQLQHIFEKLIFVLADLKQQEKLNQDLTQQSLQFIDLSLELLQPHLNKNLNYGQGSGQQTKRQSSVFDSKA